MKKRRVVFALNARSWLGLLALAIVAIPVAAVSLVFLALVLLLLGVLMAIGVGRLLFLRFRGRPSAGGGVVRPADEGTFTVTARDITADADARDARGEARDQPPLHGPRR